MDGIGHACRHPVVGGTRPRGPSSLAGIRIACVQGGCRGSPLVLLILPSSFRLLEAIGERTGGESDDTVQIAGPSYHLFTYGSGADKREEFGEDALLFSDPVDARPLLPAWKAIKTLYWGFDPSRLPINGTVWLPDGTDEVPVVLMVHGNHLAEQDSDKGYAYLGERLAAHGYAFVSVDENFLNYSVWSDIPDQDMQLRAWLLLRHLDQLAEWSAEPGNPLFGRLDIEEVALAGHSRGGQAAAMAADASRWFEGDGNGAGRIRAVAALAPTDMDVEGKHSMLKVYQLSRPARGSGCGSDGFLRRAPIQPDQLQPGLSL